MNRRQFLTLGSAGLVAGTRIGAHPGPSHAAETPKLDGTFWVSAVLDPSGFDPHPTVNFWTMISVSFTHSRLVKHRAGPGVEPGTFPIEPDLAESWASERDDLRVQAPQGRPLAREALRRRPRAHR